MDTEKNGESIRELSTDGTDPVERNQSQIATDFEKNMTFFQALRLYPKAVAWTMFFSLGIVMAAFDPQLLGTLFATPAFQRDFGYKYKGSYIISAPWQTALYMGNPLGQVLGPFFATYPMEWFGRKKTFAAGLVGTTACVFIQFFARSLPVLFVGELIGGLLYCTLIVLVPTYASEVLPVALRGVLTANVNISYVTGQLIGSAVPAGTQMIRDHWAYSIPFAVQWTWPAILLIGLPFAPESPWWLVRKGRQEDAEKALRRLASPKVNVANILANIAKTDRLEREMQTGATFLDCFRKINRRRTEIAVGGFAMQALSGVWLLGYITYFFTLAGLDDTLAFDMGVVVFVAGFCGTVASYPLILYTGRRRIYNTGLYALTIFMLLVGILDCPSDYNTHPGLTWAQAILLAVWNVAYNISIGPLGFVLYCEVPATKLRSKTIALSIGTQALVGVISTVAIPYMINPDQANLRGKTAFLFGGLSLLGSIWAYFRIPETKGRTYEELDLMFEKGVKTRDFKKYRFD